jgi:putative iron-dependent peroxidase
MASPQNGIFVLGTSSQAYLEFDMAAGAQPAEAVARIAALREPRTTVGGVNLVSGFRPELWAVASPDVASPDAAPPGSSGSTSPSSGRPATSSRRPSTMSSCG